MAVRSGSRIIALIVVACTLVSVLLSSFPTISVVPLFSGPASNQGNGMSLDSSETLNHGDTSILDPDRDIRQTDAWNSTVFQVVGKPATPYLRTSVFNMFSSGKWTATNTNGMDMEEEVMVTPPVPEGATRETRYLSIIPERPITGGVPVFKDTYVVVTPVPLRYYPEYQTFKTSEEISISYFVGYYHYRYDGAALLTASVHFDDDYSNVPQEYEERIQTLAEFVTQNCTTPYEKVVAVREFLQTNYVYDYEYEPAPKGQDPVLWFLFNSKKGVCGHFNTAFALMLRTLDIPTRYVNGYLLNPGSSQQSVSLNHAHAYIEVRFEGVGWVIFDATALSYAQSVELKEPLMDWKQKLVRSRELANASLCRIDGSIFDDRNGDGQYSYGEGPARDMNVGLYTEGGRLVRVASTGDDGGFGFDHIAPDNYTVRMFLGRRWVAVGDDQTSFHCLPYGVYLTRFYVQHNPEAVGDRPSFVQIWSRDLEVMQRETFSLNGTVLDGEGRPLNGMEVQLLVEGDDESTESVVCSEGVVSEGLFTLHGVMPDGMRTGPHVLLVTALGDANYTQSEASTYIKVMDDSLVYIEAPQRLPMGVAVEFHLTLFENSSLLPIPNAILYLEGEAGRELYTDEDGNVSFNMTFSMPGISTIVINYLGNPWVRGSSGMVDVEVLPVGLELLTDSLVRGEENLLIGRVFASEIPVEGCEVLLDPVVADGEEMNGTTNPYGYFTLTLEIPTDGPGRGFHQLNFTIANLTRTSREIRFKDRPQIGLSSTPDTVNVHLTGPSNEPIPSALVTVSTTNVTKSAITDPSGAATVLIDASASNQVTVSFEGNDLYAPVTLDAVLVPKTTDWTLVIVLGAVAVSAGAVAYRLKTRTREEPEVEQPPAPLDISGPYRIEFPQIADDLPGVWGIGEPIDVRIAGPLVEMKAWVDGQEIGRQATDESFALFQLTLPYGKHSIEAVGPSGGSLRHLQIVDYREHVVTLYREGLIAIREKVPEITGDKAPREVQRLLGERLPAESGAVVERMVSLFEIAEFSEHQMGRTQFEEMYRAVEVAKSWFAG